MLHILRFFFSSRCRLFHNATFFGSCNIHILNTVCAKILKEFPAPKVNIALVELSFLELISGAALETTVALFL